jgi:stress response protein YsnF
MGEPQARDLSSKLQDITEAVRRHLSNGEFQDLEKLLAEYEDMFAVDSEDHGQTNKVYRRSTVSDNTTATLLPDIFSIE